MTIITDYKQETFENQLKLLNILLDTNKKLERIAIILEKKNSDEEKYWEEFTNKSYGGTK
tara:strand:- start:848 stop:1027 length:180 start_codon:yes stop_codon:yes gene_type:complete